MIKFIFYTFFEKNPIFILRINILVTFVEYTLEDLTNVLCIRKVIFMKKTRLNSSIIAATSLTGIVLNQQVEAKLFTADELSTLGGGNVLAADASVEALDFSNLTQTMNIAQPGESLLDLSGFTGARQIILPWFAVQLNIVFPENFGSPKDDSYGWLTFVGSGVETLDLTMLLASVGGKVGVDTTSLSS